MIITHHYTLDFDEERDLYIVQNKQSPMCPDCGGLLSLNGDTLSSQKIPCTLIRSGPESGTQTLAAGERAVIASFRGTSKIAYAWGSLIIDPGHGSVSGRYSNMLYFDISVEEIA